MPALAVIGVWAGAAAGTTAAVTTGAAVVATTATVAAAGYMGYSSYQAGKSQQALANYNAQLAQKQAQSNMQVGANRAALQRMQNQELLKKQEGAYAASGVVASSGSPLSLEVRDAGLLELGAQQTEYETRTGANYLQGQSQLDIMQGRIARQAGNMNATASILQGIGSGVSGYYGTKG